MDSEKEGDIERAREREVKRLSTERPAIYHDVVASILAETVALKGIWHGKFRMFNRALDFTTTANRTDGTHVFSSNVHRVQSTSPTNSCSQTFFNAVAFDISVQPDCSLTSA